MNIAPLIDHTSLSPNATEAEIRRLCEEAMEYGFHSVCVAPYRVPLAAGLLEGSAVAVCSVVGFPHGNTVGAVKGIEAESVLSAGGDEIDMVINIGALRDGDDSAVAADIALVAEVVQTRSSALLKVILETAYLSADEIIRGCRLAEQSGAAFVKTSTGFGPLGATVEVVRLMRETVGERLGVKAAGGIRDYSQAKAMVVAGANRIGASASLAIVAGQTP